MPGKNMTTISFCLPTDLRERIREAAEEDGRSVSSWITQAIKQSLRGGDHHGEAEQGSA